MEYRQYSQRVITGYKSLYITSFPRTIIYEWFGDFDVNESLQEDKSYVQEIKLKMPYADRDALMRLDVVLNTRVRVITEAYSGKLKMYGVMSGLETEVKTYSGGSQNSFNGYELKMSGIEEFESHFLSGLESANFYLSDDVIAACFLSSSSEPASSSAIYSLCNIVQTV
jgi:hypothetical protein